MLADPMHIQATGSDYLHSCGHSIDVPEPAAELEGLTGREVEHVQRESPVQGPVEPLVVPCPQAVRARRGAGAVGLSLVSQRQFGPSGVEESEELLRLMQLRRIASAVVNRVSDEELG